MWFGRRRIRWRAILLIVKLRFLAAILLAGLLDGQTQRLGIGRLTVHLMLEQRIIPSIRVGRLWIITRSAYEEWERTCGTSGDSGLEIRTQPEVRVT